MVRVTNIPDDPSSPYRRGFTLIELLVVVSIISVLVSILLPALGRAREQARISVCASNQHQIVLAVHLYGYDYDGRLPSVAAYSLNIFNEGSGDCFLLSDYCEVPNAFYCPSSEFQADTPVDTNPGDTYFRYERSAGIWSRYLSYSCFISAPKYDFYEDIPTNLDQPGSWVVWADYDSFLDSTGVFWQSNHPANYGAYDERPPPNPDRWGLNVATLDGAVSWRHDSETDTIYPKRPDNLSWWTRF